MENKENKAGQFNEYYSKTPSPEVYWGYINPDKELVNAIDKFSIKPGLCLDIGCGNGKNSVYLAGRKFEVRAIDFSKEAIQIARSRLTSNMPRIKFEEADILLFDTNEKYDFIVDCCCFHCIEPHERKGYANAVVSSLKESGYFFLKVFMKGHPITLGKFEIKEYGFVIKDLKRIFGRSMNIIWNEETINGDNRNFISVLMRLKK